MRGLGLNQVVGINLIYSALDETHGSTAIE